MSTNSENESAQNTDGNRTDIGRNEPCPCGSGKKYKRCCGVNAAPKLGDPRKAPDFSALAGGQGALGASGGFSPDQMDPAQMMQVAQALQRLPRGQMQRLQSLMQKAMSGKDVTREAEEFQRSLPVDLQEMLLSMKLPGMEQVAGGAAQTSDIEVTASSGEAEMTPEQARKLVEEAAKAGQISQAEAETLLQSSEQFSGNTPATASATDEQKSGFSKLWRSITKKG